MTRENGAYLTPSAAWKRLGIYGGDDGLTANIAPDIYQKAASQMGLVLDTEVIRKGKMGISFLARSYGPAVWYGDVNSTCDLPRQLTKFHTTTTLPEGVTAKEKLLEKVRSFHMTDANTPILGEFVSRAMRLAGTIVMTEKTRLMRAWNSDLDKEVQYPNVDTGWMEDYARNALAPFGFDFDLFRDWLETCRTVDDMLTPPVMCTPTAVKAERPVVVDDDIHHPKAPAGSRVTKVPRGIKRQSQRTSVKRPPQQERAAGKPKAGGAVPRRAPKPKNGVRRGPV
jgi:hypothetical protein